MVGDMPHREKGSLFFCLWIFFRNADEVEINSVER